MANTRTSSPAAFINEGHAAKFEEVSVDTDPGADGYGCNAVSFNGATPKVFYIASIGAGATVTLQWKRSTASTWTDYADYTTVTRQVIQEYAPGIQWRATVKDNNQGSSGSSVFGICW